MTERLTDKERQLLHNLNMAARKVRKTNDIHDWYYYHSKIHETLSNEQLKRLYGLQNYSRTRRNSAAKDKL